jgi:hypothetical protein
MNKLARTALGLVAILVVAGAAPAYGEYGGPKPTFRTEAAYFHCGGKVQNPATGATSWNTTAPTQSATAGAGCVATDPNLVAAVGDAHENIYDALFTGSYTGNLKDLTVKLHSLVTSQVQSAGAVSLRVRLAIDGEPLFTDGLTAPTVTVTPTAGANPAVQVLEFSIHNLGFAKYINDASGNLVNVQTGGLGKEDGDGEIEHSITISVDTTGSGDQGLFVMDASEAPSGITFNPTTLSPAKIKSPLPSGG